MFRRKYYDFFSKFYDKFIKLHSGDKQERLRDFFAENADIKENFKILDICCGTGSTTFYMQKKSEGKNVTVFGVDFSFGMLEKAVEKCGSNNFILSNVSLLPFKNNVFNRVTCTFAFYELSGTDADKALSEIKRVLSKEGKFLMMEHEPPKKFLIKMLFYIRLMSMGFKKARNILKNEEKIFKKHFKNVKKVTSPSNNSKIWICS